MNTNEQNFSNVWDTMKLTCIKYRKVNTQREREKEKTKVKKILASPLRYSTISKWNKLKRTCPSTRRNDLCTRALKING